MSHELRTPLTAILGYAQILAAHFDGKLSDNQHGYVEHIIHAGNHLLSLINEILDLSVIETGNLNLNLELTSAQPVIADALSLIAPMAKARNINVQRTGSDEFDYIVMADHARLKQIMLNLLSNAVKYNRENGLIKVDIAQQQNDLKVSIADTGKGLSEQQQEQLFMPFNRLSFENSNIEGTGIGLTITKQLVESMGGQIGVKSAVDLGSVFWFTLPIIEVKSKQTPQQNVRPTPTRIDISQPATVRILLAEDHKANQDLISTLMRKLGFEIDIAVDGEQAVKLWRQHSYDLILMDLNMPKMNGIDATKTIRASGEANHEVPIIALTASAMKGDRESCLASGMNDYIEKPVNFEKFKTVLDLWLTKGTVN